MTATLAALLVFALALRVVTQLLSRSSARIDHWFWKGYVETVRREGRFPPHLPQYRLEQEQWYPPVFPWLLVRLPRAVFPRFEPWLAIALDLLRLALLVVAAPSLAGVDPSAVTAAGIIYATAPVLVIYNVQLNPRALGALFLDAGGTLALMAAAPGSSPWLWAACALLGGLVLLTHRMTTQLMVFLCLAGAALAGDVRLALLIPASVVVALVLSGGFYRKVVRAHVDIVTFWYRNWPWLQADPIRESPLYGEPGYESPQKLHRQGFPGLVRHLRSLLRLLPGGWVYLVMTVAGLFVFPWPGVPEGWVRPWVELVLGFALATTFLPGLKCLGAGTLYLYNAAFPLALAWAWVIQVEPSTFFTWTPRGVGLTLVASLAVIAVLWGGLFTHRARSEDGWEDVIRFLAEAPRGVVFCLPQQRFDEIAYRTGQPVAYGGHGFGLRKLEPLFPRLLISVAELHQRFEVRYFVAREDTMTERLLEDLPRNPTRLGRYRVYTLKG